MERRANPDPMPEVRIAVVAITGIAEETGIARTTVHGDRISAPRRKSQLQQPVTIGALANKGEESVADLLATGDHQRPIWQRQMPRIPQPFGTRIVHVCWDVIRIQARVAAKSKGTDAVVVLKTQRADRIEIKSKESPRILAEAKISASQNRPRSRAFWENSWEYLRKRADFTLIG